MVYRHNVSGIRMKLPPKSKSSSWGMYSFNKFHENSNKQTNQIENIIAFSELAQVAFYTFYTYDTRLVYLYYLHISFTAKKTKII